MPSDLHVAIFRLIRSKKDFLITGHQRPDGDLCGSAIALHAALTGTGNKARIVLPDPIPARYSRMKGAGNIETFDGQPFDVDAVFVLDAADLSRLGPLAAALPDGVPLVNIDHHVSNSGFGNICWCEGDRSSTGEMIYELARAGGWPLPLLACQALYIALLTDTGRFSYSNTSAPSLRVAAELVELGVDPAAMADLIYRNRAPRELALQQRALSSLRLSSQGRVCSMSLSWNDFQELQATPTDAQDFAAMTVSLAGVQLGIFLYELDGDGHTKISVRGSDDADAGALAALFGGGGHRAAAGCRLDCLLAEAVETMAQAAAGMLAGKPEV
jgi:bifunctional oligoribonuclease and PAP phosphatase NrnA